MEFESGKHGNLWVIAVKGRMDAVTAPDFEKECSAAMDADEKALLIDFGELEYISSAGIRSILSTAKKMNTYGGRIDFCNLTGMVKEVFAISGVNALFQIFDSVEQAASER